MPHQHGSSHPPFWYIMNCSILCASVIPKVGIGVTDGIGVRVVVGTSILVAVGDNIKVAVDLGVCMGNKWVALACSGILL